MNVQLTYVFDAYCGWCHGFGPAVEQFTRDNADRATVEVLSGGLFVDGRRAPIGAMGYVADANARIARLTGATFGSGYQALVADGRFVMDSTAAAAGVAALRAQAPERAVAIAERVQQAFYHDGRSLSDPATFRDLAVGLGVDPDAVPADLDGPAARAAARADFAAAARLGVTSYPTLLLHIPGGLVRLGNPAASAAHLTEALDRALVTA